MIWNRRRAIYYGVFTVLFSILWFLFKLGGIPVFELAISSTLIDVTICLGSLLVAVEWLLPGLAYHTRYFRFLFYFFLLVLVAGSCIILAQLALMGTSLFSYRQMVAKFKDHYLYWFWSDLIFGSYFLVAFVSTVGCSIRLAFDRLVALRKVAILQKERTQAELDTLKDQINPHFLFNTLNAIYYQIDRANLEARKSLEQFSSLLRYQLYECSGATVPIEQEVAFIANYIDLQRRRFQGQCKIDSDGFSEIKGFSIPPYLLSPLIENCFKHVTRTTGSENFVRIKCHRLDDWFSLETINSIGDKETAKPGGIGLNNVRKRLSLSYPDGAYALSVHQDGNIFALELKLKVS